jgi:hypothetical protein
VVDSFVLGGTEVAKRRVQAARVEPALDVLENGASKSGSRGPRTFVNKLPFDGGEKRFRYRNVDVTPGSQDDEQFCEDCDVINPFSG